MNRAPFDEHFEWDTEKVGGRLKVMGEAFKAMTWPTTWTSMMKAMYD